MIASPLALGGCATTTGTGATSVYCRVAQPIRWSVQDTDETIRQIKLEHAKRKELCGR